MRWEGALRDGAMFAQLSTLLLSPLTLTANVQTELTSYLSQAAAQRLKQHGKDRANSLLVTEATTRIFLLRFTRKKPVIRIDKLALHTKKSSLTIFGQHNKSLDRSHRQRASHQTDPVLISLVLAGGGPVNSDVMRLHDSMIVDRPKFISAICAFLGSIVLIITVYLFINRIIFLTRANSFSAPIVAVSHEWVSKGRGGVLAYVPTVRVQGLEEELSTLRLAHSTRNLSIQSGNRWPCHAILCKAVLKTRSSQNGAIV